MGRTYRRRDKRRAYRVYAAQSQELVRRLQEGELTQEQFERAHDFLDEQYRGVR
jgi:hypothetical protein